MVYVIQLAWTYMVAFLCKRHTVHTIGYYSSEENKRSKLYLFLVFVSLFFIMALRDLSVGVDTVNYKNIFDVISQLSWKELFIYNEISVEIGWRFFIKICSVFSSSYFFFQCIYAFIYSYLCARFIYKSEPKNILEYTVIFMGFGLFIGAFNVQRQFLAVMILANAFISFKNKHYIVYIILQLIALTIHISSIVFIVAPMVYLFRKTNWVMKLIPILIFVVIIAYEPLFKLIQVLFPKYENYFANNKIKLNAGGIWMIWMALIAIAIYVIYISKKNDTDFKVICIFSLIYVMANIIGLSFNYADRIGYYFLPFLPETFCSFANKFNSNNMKKVYNTAITVFFSVYYLLSCYTGASMHYKLFF